MKFEISLRWKNVLPLLAIVCIVFAGFYWWRNIRPYVHIDQAILCIASSELLSEKTGRLTCCHFDEGDFFQQGQELFAFDLPIEIDQKLEKEKRKIEQGMEQYLYLQAELKREEKTSEVLDQILTEVQSAEKMKNALELELVKEKDAISAPFDGHVLRRYKNVGEHVLSGEPLLLVLNQQKRWIEAKIPEEMLMKVHIGSLAHVQFPSFPKKTWPAQISWISPRIEEGMLTIRLTAENLPSYAGLSAKVAFKTR